MIFPRALGALTALYGAYTLARPGSLARAAGLLPRDSPVTPANKRLGWAIGTRDLVSGLSMLVAPAGTPLRIAVAARVACDVGDAIGFGVTVPRSSRVKVVVIAAGWGLICASALSVAGSQPGDGEPGSSASPSPSAA